MSNSVFAQGGIAAANRDEASIARHVIDTLKAGDGLSNEAVVRAIIEASPDAIEVLQKAGVRFDCDANSKEQLSKEGGHSERRIYHHGDQTGAEMMRALSTAVSRLENVDVLEYHTAVNLITQEASHQPGSQKEVIGAYVLDEYLSLIHTVYAKLTVLATGGAGKVYRYTSNASVATGDGIAMAYRAGARVGNMAFYQFHPTLLYHPQNNHFLISEALRGEGAYLRLADTGERFMQQYAPEEMELATRDVVARAVFNEIEKSGAGHVYLDVRHLDADMLATRFPNILATLNNLDIDVSKDMIPVVPAAHYLCGGIMTDVAGKTDLQRLYAIGETAFTGLHGANRLASNSLLEGVVMGDKAARDSMSWLNKPFSCLDQHKKHQWDSNTVIDLRRASQINAHWRGLRGEMTSYAGIVRTEAGLKDLLRLIASRREIIEAYYWKHIITRDLVELRNIILVAELIVRSALNRRESIGGHYREDYPSKSTCSKEALISKADTEIASA